MGDVDTALGWTALVCFCGLTVTLHPDAHGLGVRARVFLFNLFGTLPFWAMVWIAWSRGFSWFAMFFVHRMSWLTWGVITAHLVFAAYLGNLLKKDPAVMRYVRPRQ